MHPLVEPHPPLEVPIWEELKKPMIDLLLKYYNGEDQGNDFVDQLTSVLKVLCRWRFHGKINPQSLLNFMIDHVLAEDLKPRHGKTFISLSNNDFWKAGFRFANKIIDKPTAMSEPFLLLCQKGCLEN